MDQSKDFLAKIKDLEDRIKALESTNQVDVIKIGTGSNQITLDGTQGKMFIGSGSNFVIDGATQKIQVSRSGSTIDIMDSYGLISNSNVTSAFGSTSIGINQSITASITDITGMSLLFSTLRTVRIFVVGQVAGWIYNTSTGDFVGDGISYINIDGGEVRRSIEGGGKIGTDVQGGIRFFTTPLHYMGTLGSGSHTVKLQASCSQVTGAPGFNIYQAALSYQIIGN